MFHIHKIGHVIALPYRVVFNKWGELGVGHDAVKRSVNVRRNLAINFEILDFAFYTTWFHEPGELRSGREMRPRHLGA